MRLLFITLSVIGASFACQPVKIHLQSTYCDSPLVAVIKIDKEIPSTNPFPYQLEYEGTVLDSVKGSDLTKGTKVTVATDGPSNSCGPVILRENITYMILGQSTEPKRIEAKLFNGAIDVTNKTEENNIRRRMESYDCTCDVQSYFYGMPPDVLPPLPNECKATDIYGCQWDDGACVRNSEGKCNYVHDCPAGSVP